jgi:hypothetical protein
MRIGQKDNIYATPFMLSYASMPQKILVHKEHYVKNRTTAFILILGMLAMLTVACAFSFSTANFDDAFMAADPDGNQRTTVYGDEDVFYAIADLANASDDTVVRAVWIAVDVDDTEPNLLIDEVSITSGDARLTFDLANEAGLLWPNGQYRVDLYLNDELETSLDFQVQ